MNEIIFTTQTEPVCQTCAVNDIFLHSRYNPQKEAERFVQNIQTDFEPLCVIITGPSLSYCAPFLRERFPAAHLIAIQYSTAFTPTNTLWNLVLQSDSFTLGEDLYNAVGEERWGATIFVSWKPSEIAYPTDFLLTWQTIKEVSVKCRNVLTTRAYFNKRWLKNCVQFCCKAERVAVIKKGTCPVVIAASGSNLLESITALKKYRKHFFLAALSSAVLPLLKNSIVPDIIITTDGGYWAKVHLQALEREKTVHTVPVTAAFEAALPSNLLKKIRLIPLSYGDGIDVSLARLCGIPFGDARRNGTVSGTAAELFLSLTTNKVFFCGLDLAENPGGYAHTQPNALEKAAIMSDYRLAPTETRHTAGFTQTTALNIYASWFTSQPQDFSSRVFRICGKNPYRKDLSPICTVSWEEVLNSDSTKNTKITFDEQPLPSATERAKIVQKYVISKKKRVLAELATASDAHLTAETEFWLKTVNLGAFLRLQRSKLPADTVLQKECAAFFDTLIGITTLYAQ